MNRRSTKEPPRTGRPLLQVFRPKEHRADPLPASLPNRENPTPCRVGIPFLFFVAFSIFVAAGGFIYHLHVRFEGVRLGYEASQARRAQARLMLERRELRLELASLKEPGRIEDEARNRLGMEAPAFDRIVPLSGRRRTVSVSGGAL